jgi:hypothetical protein
MILSLDFCEARAATASLAADQATLDNVRQRELRSAAAWQALADQARKVREGRETGRD